MKKLIFKILILVNIAHINGAGLTLSHERGTIYIEEQKGWELSKDIFGMPFMYFSPKHSGQRSNISFAHTGTDFTFDKKEMKKNESQYREGKEKWAKKVGASILKVSPYLTFKNNFGHLVHKIGVQYKFKKKHYFETSYYIECKKKMLFSKTLRLQQAGSHQKSFDKIIKSVNCE
tara:strand:+ start:82777 stop:83301 length:525 start_codon:yes stop_codon:yes gene_type:complete